MGLHHLRDAQKSSADAENAAPGGLTKRMKKLVETPRSQAEIREFLESGRRRIILRQPDSSLACVSSGLTRCGVFCDLNLIIHFPPSEPAVMRPISFSPEERAFRMYLSHLFKGRQLNDCDSTSSYTGRVKGAARGLSKSKDSSFAARRNVSKGQSCQFARTFPQRDEFTLPAFLAGPPSFVRNPRQVRREGESRPRACR